MKLPYGIHRNLPREEYDRLTGDNYSSLKLMEKSPLAYRYNRDNPCEPTEAMILGHHLHVALLEPSLCNFAVWPGPGPRNGHKYDAWCDENADKTQVTAKQHEAIGGMVKSILGHPAAARYFKHTSAASTEVTLFWRDPVFKRDCKARLDTWKEIGEETYLISLKKAVDVSEKWFGRQYADLCYHAQDAFYQAGFLYATKGIELPKMVTIAVEPKAPHEVAVYQISIDILRLGQQKIGEWTQKLERCERSGKWPGAIEGEQELTLPSWAYPQGDFNFDDLEVMG